MVLLLWDTPLLPKKRNLFFVPLTQYRSFQSRRGFFRIALILQLPSLYMCYGRVPFSASFQKKELPGLCPHPFLFPTSGVFFQQYECDDHGLDSYHPYRKPGYHIWRQYAVICSQISPLTSMYAIGAEDGADDDADNTSSGQLSHSTLRQKIPSR